MENTLPQGDTDPRTADAAERAVERALPVARRRPDLAARAYAALSQARRVRLDQNQLALSLAALRDAEAWLARAPAPDSLTSAEVIRAGAMYAKARGDNQHAAELAGRRLALLERALGPLDRRVMHALMQAAFYWARIDIDEALRLREKLLDRRRRVWGDRRTPPRRPGGEGACLQSGP